MTRLHRADGHVLDAPIEVVAGVEQLTGHLLHEHREGRVGEDRPIRQGAQQPDAMSGESLAQDIRQGRVRVRIHLVHDRTQDLDATPGEERVVEHDLVDGLAHARLGDDHRGRAQECRHVRVRQPDDRADTRMTGTLDEQYLPIPGCDVICREDAGTKVLGHLARDERRREATRDVHRAHDPELVGHPEHRADQDRILVRGDAIDDRVPLAHGLHEAGRETAVHERRQESQRERGLAAVHAGRGEIHLAHRDQAHRPGRRIFASRFRRRGGSANRDDRRLVRTGCP